MPAEGNWTGDIIAADIQELEEMARAMGSPRHVSNRRRRTREGPEPAGANTIIQFGVAHAGGEELSTFETFSRRNFFEDRDTILDLTAKIQWRPMKISCTSFRISNLSKHLSHSSSTNCDNSSSFKSLSRRHDQMWRSRHAGTLLEHFSILRDGHTSTIFTSANAIDLVLDLAS